MPSKRTALVEATKALLWERGYEATSPRAIIETSGAGQGSFYHHFSGKADLAAAALEQIGAEMNEGFDNSFATDARPLERLEAYLSLPRDGLKGCRLGRLANESAISDGRLRGPIARYFRHVEGVVAGTLEQARSENGIPAESDCNALAAALVAVIQGGYTLSRIHRDTKHIGRATDGALILLRGLAAAGSASTGTNPQPLHRQGPDH